MPLWGILSASYSNRTKYALVADWACNRTPGQALYGHGGGKQPSRGKGLPTMTKQPRHYTVYTLTVSNKPKAPARVLMCYSRQELDRAVDNYAADRGVSGLAVIRTVNSQGVA